MLKSETKLTVRYAETDKMGIAHHSNYAVWFEAGRTDFFRKLGYPYSELEKEGFLLPLTDLKCSFQKPARYEDGIVISTRISRITCVRAIFTFEVFGMLSNDLLATGETSHAWTDSNLKPINLSKEFSRLFEALSNSLKGE